MAAVTAGTPGSFDSGPLGEVWHRRGRKSDDCDARAQRVAHPQRATRDRPRAATACGRSRGERSHAASDRKPLSGYYGREQSRRASACSRDAVTAATTALTRAEMELQAAQGATARIASTIADHEGDRRAARPARKRERTASASNTASLIGDLKPPAHLAEAEYNLSRASRSSGGRRRAAVRGREHPTPRGDPTHPRPNRRRRGGCCARASARREPDADAHAASVSRGARGDAHPRTRRGRSRGRHSARESYIDIGTQLAEGARARAVVELTRRTEELGDASAREAAASAGRYRSTVERVAQLDRESAARRQLIADLARTTR